MVLDGSDPQIVLDARNETNRQGSLIQLRPDLADDLRRWIEKKGPGSPTPSESQVAARMRCTEPLFAISPNLVKVFNRDLYFAGIPKRDERNRTACVHSLRHNFASLLCRGGVAPRIAQAAMRHASVEMTMQTYTDPKLLDVAGALRVLPEFPIAATALAGAGIHQGCT